MDWSGADGCRTGYFERASRKMYRTSDSEAEQEAKKVPSAQKYESSQRGSLQGDPSAWITVFLQSHIIRRIPGKCNVRNSYEHLWSLRGFLLVNNLSDWFWLPMSVQNFIWKRTKEKMMGLRSSGWIRVGKESCTNVDLVRLKWLSKSTRVFSIQIALFKNILEI